MDDDRTAVAARPETPMNAALARVDTELENLRSTLAHLTDQLYPVMGDVGAEGSDADAIWEPDGAPLVRRVLSYAREIDDMRDTLQALIQRLEV